MDELVSAYIAKKEGERNAALEEEKRAFLLERELYYKVYANDKAYDPQYPFSEWDEATQAYKYFQKVPVQITNSEYEALLKLERNTRRTPNSHNTIATILTVMAWLVFIGGFIAGIVLGTSDYGYRTEFSFEVAIIYWSVSLVTGIFILGFAEIIKLLHAIKNK